MNLADTLNEAFGRTKRKAAEPKTMVIATYRGQEQTVVKNSKGLWGAQLDRVYVQNSRLGDLIQQIEENGGTVERRAL